MSCSKCTLKYILKWFWTCPNGFYPFLNHTQTYLKTNNTNCIHVKQCNKIRKIFRCIPRLHLYLCAIHPSALYKSAYDIFLIKYIIYIFYILFPFVIEGSAQRHVAAKLITIFLKKKCQYNLPSSHILQLTC